MYCYLKPDVFVPPGNSQHKSKSKGYCSIREPNLSVPLAFPPAPQPMSQAEIFLFQLQEILSLEMARSGTYRPGL